MKTTYFFQDHPLFGLDISAGKARVMQINQPPGKSPEIIGFGSCDFSPKAVKDGIITDPALVAKALQGLFKSGLEGQLTTHRVALSIPAAKTFSRAIKLPVLKDDELDDAVRLEAEQYIPMPIDALYLDYSLIHKTKDEIELFAVATQKPLIDSYLKLCEMLDIEPVAIETTIDAATRLFVHTDTSRVPAVLVDFGPNSADITIVDNMVIATGTVSGGGDNFTSQISSKLGVSTQEAHMIKTMYGLNVSQKQRQIAEALNPVLDKLFDEIRRMIRYNDERYGADRKISQIVLMGAGSNIPGLSDHMTDALRLPVRTSDPWKTFIFGKDNSLPSTESQAYVTAAGLSLIRPEELFA